MEPQNNNGVVVADLLEHIFDKCVATGHNLSLCTMDLV